MSTYNPALYNDDDDEYYSEKQVYKQQNVRKKKISFGPVTCYPNQEPGCSSINIWAISCTGFLTISRFLEGIIMEHTDMK